MQQASGTQAMAASAAGGGWARGGAGGAMGGAGGAAASRPPSHNDDGGATALGWVGVGEHVRVRRRGVSKYAWTDGLVSIVNDDGTVDVETNDGEVAGVPPDDVRLLLPFELERRRREDAAAQVMTDEEAAVAMELAEAAGRGDEEAARMAALAEAAGVGEPVGRRGGGDGSAAAAGGAAGGAGGAVGASAGGGGGGGAAAAGDAPREVPVASGGDVALARAAQLKQHGVELFKLEDHTGAAEYFQEALRALAGRGSPARAPRSGPAMGLSVGSEVVVRAHPAVSRSDAGPDRAVEIAAGGAGGAAVASLAGGSSGKPAKSGAVTSVGGVSVLALARRGIISTMDGGSSSAEPTVGIIYDNDDAVAPLMREGVLVPDEREWPEEEDGVPLSRVCEPLVEGSAASLRLALLQNLSRCAFNVGNHLEAATYASHAILLAPLSATPHFLRGKAFTALGRWKRARDDLEHAAQLDAGNKQVAKALRNMYKQAEVAMKRDRKLAKDVGRWIDATMTSAGDVPY